MAPFSSRSVCKECGRYEHANDYGYCKSCVDERIRRIINSKSKPEVQHDINATSDGPLPARPSQEPRVTGIVTPHADPLRLSRAENDEKPKSIDEVEWRQYGPNSECAYWNELPKAFTSRFQAEDGFRITIEDVEYSFHTMYGGMVCRRLRPNPSRSQATRPSVAALVKNDGTSAEINLEYGNPRAAWTRRLTRDRLSDDDRSSIVEKLFTLNKEKKKDISKFVHVEKEMIGVVKNTLLMQIDVQYGKQFTRTISGGNYDFVGGSKTGYFLSLSVQSDDDYLLRTAVAIIRRLSFACYPSNFSAYCFLEHNMPTLAGQRELLTTICERILSEVNHA